MRRDILNWLVRPDIVAMLGLAVLLGPFGAVGGVVQILVAALIQMGAIAVRNANLRKPPRIDRPGTANAGGLRPSAVPEAPQRRLDLTPLYFGNPNFFLEFTARGLQLVLFNSAAVGALRLADLAVAVPPSWRDACYDANVVCAMASLVGVFAIIVAVFAGLPKDRPAEETKGPAP